ncbi:flagellar hook-basal body protein [Borrelia crocidurae]|uniref:Flagellar hook-basal body complex protein n=1 Tax=Borrelia crocidurae (strain Achema) TaxID=1155096 RepID=I0FDL0_BORCA|nr:flagellar hook-basal body protein [Borrelia crocidurae]AFI31566.1 Flagellar hook-basal body complex protein [Borrelia crocidurae str. Achema]
MVRGIYTAASGMIAQRHRLEVIANNLANVDLTGYKKDLSVQKAFPEMLIRRTNDDGLYKFPKGYLETAPVVGKLGTGVEESEIYTSFEQGPLKITGNSLDLALTEEGFFVVQTPEGERYTRNGSFTLGREGILITKDGYPVIGEKGYIHIKDNNFKITEQGQIFHNSTFESNPKRLVSESENSWENYELLDNLKIVNFEKARFLKKQGSSLWYSTEISGQAKNIPINSRPKIESGVLECSNVNAINEMVSMITVNRIYEANQKTIQTEDTLLGKLINEIGKF